MATSFEKTANSAFTYLQTPVGVSDLSIQVYDSRRLPQDGGFRIRIGKEIMRVTSVSDETLLVERGTEGTQARVHNINDLVVAVLTQDGLDQLMTDRVLLAKSRPPQASIRDRDGDVMQVADMTWVNQGSATATDTNGTIYMNGLRSSSGNARILVTAAPASTPWTATLGFRPHLFHNTTANDGFPQAGLALRHSTASSRLLFLNLFSRSGTTTGGKGVLRTQLEQMNSPTSFSSTLAGTRIWNLRYNNTVWYRVTDDGTDLVWELSADGVNWTEIGTYSRTGWLTSGPNQVGFYVDPAGNDATTIDNYCVFSHFSFS